MKENVKVVEMGEMAKKGHKRLMFILQLHEWQIQIRNCKGDFCQRLYVRFGLKMEVLSPISILRLLTQTLCHVRIEADGDEK